MANPNRFVVLVPLLLLTLGSTGCSMMNKSDDQSVSQSPTTSALLFSRDAELTSSVRPYRPQANRAAEKWDVKRSFNSGRTRISATRSSGKVTEYYTSNTGPDGSSARRRAVSRP